MGTDWMRSDLKWRAKEALRRNYWAVVAVSLILAIVTAAGAGSGIRETVTHEYQYQTGSFRYGSVAAQWAGKLWSSMNPSLWSSVAVLFGVGMLMLLAVIVLGFHFFAGNVLEVGARSFYIENLYSAPRTGRVLSAFRSGHYGNVVKVMFCRDLFVFLWSLLFVIPGIVKSYEYHMVPYLLAEYPDMPREEAFARSREMMYGQKWNTFVLDISFLPWILLSGITFKIAGIFYVNPYIDATHAELYDVLAGKMEGGAV